MNRYIDYVCVNRGQVSLMMENQKLKVTDVAKRMKCSPTTLYGYLKKEKMPKRMANDMMDAIFDGNPPFYYHGDDANEVSPCKHARLTYPNYVSDLISAQLYLRRAIMKMSEMDRNCYEEALKGVDADGD